jgi:hypothetical protein
MSDGTRRGALDCINSDERHAALHEPVYRHVFGEVGKAVARMVNARLVHRIPECAACCLPGSGAYADPRPRADILLTADVRMLGIFGC